MSAIAGCHSAAGFLRLSGASPSWLTTGDGAGRGEFFGRLAAGLAFLSALPFFFSSFFFLLPAALPEALRFFGP